MKDTLKVIKILEKYYKNYRRPTLRRTSKEKNPYKTLITCLISLRVQDATTERVSSNLFKIADTPKKISKLSLKRLEKILYSTGYYKQKAKTIKYVTNVILKKYKGKVPNTEEELLSIKGIGRKTANIVLSFAYNKLALPVDVNVHRIANRLNWVKTKNADKTELELKKIVPKSYWRDINTIFILFGKSICVPVSPFCSKCPVKRYCKRIGVKKSR